MAEDFYGDVAYHVWNAGGNPDLVDIDRVYAARDGGADVDETAGLELRLQRARAAVERDMREWEANEWDLPADERFSR